ncbi:hypothetical protein ACIBK9_47485 [Nonomuraea sp. NPDC050227]|uniref:hypothetical protein n=1 Tax=Nonomuraea sp. NPDC050227 TaxID=3364360 RepID=UPI0037B0A9DC
MSDTTYPREAWVRLGQQARQRRIDLGMSQPDVSAAGGPSTGVVSKIENARQSSYEDRVLAQLERALQWQSGSAHEVLRGGEPHIVGESRSAHRETPGTVTTPDRAGEDDSPITPQLRALLEQAQRRTDERLAELNKKMDEQNELIKKLLRDKRGA